ncbi:MAG: alpha/beta hydrolase [Gammaproteobacteria bacterium]|nr:alpha/beta hydrolase [Gammaproteobacteria bacterium]
MPSFRSRIVRAVTHHYFKRIDAKKRDVQAMRERVDKYAGRLRIARGVTRTADNINGLTAEWLIPEGAAQGKVLVYLHGGAYIMGGCNTHRQLASYIARAAGVRALLPEYRLAPEHPFPAAIEDAVALYRKLLNDGHAATSIVIAGDSAGGGLTMATLLSIRDAGDPLPAAACLLSPWLDLAATGASMQTHAHRDPWFRPKDMPIVRRYYCAESEIRKPLVSPIYADLAGLPPLYVQVGEDEILLSDSTRLAERVRAAGGSADIEIWPDMWHVFQAFVKHVPESRQAIQKLGVFIRHSLGLDTASKT